MYKEKDFGIIISILIIIIIFYYENVTLVLLPGTMLLISLTYPVLFRYPNRLFNYIISMIGIFISNTILIIIFYYILTPIALLRRGWHLIFRTKNNALTKTNFTNIDKTISKEDLENPY